jgi:pimeloyl-ACP methyl ester carboxylesterase
MSGPDLFDLLLRLHGAEVLGREYVFVRLARLSVAGHLDYSEISRILQAIRRRADWLPVWLEAADRHAALASAAEKAGSNASAGDGYLRASMSAHWGSLYARGEPKSVAHRRSLQLYRAGMAYYDPPAQAVEVPFEGDVLPGYLRRPRGYDPPVPVVLMVGGADTNKEELHHWGTQITRRGMAVLPFDGPGQGEHAARYHRLVMRFDGFHRAVSAILDWLSARAGELGLDLSRVGIFGNSLGGYLALDAARRDQRVGAVISNGGFCDAGSIDRWPEGVIQAFQSCLGIEDPQEALRQVREHLDLAAVPARNAPLALIVHGAREDLSDEEEARRAARMMEGSLVVIEDGWHTCTNRDHLVSPLFADWMRAALAGEVGAGYREMRAKDEKDYGRLVAVE